MAAASSLPIVSSCSGLLESPPAGGPYHILIKGKNSITLHDILAGEVWLASGQSNMTMPLKRCANGEAEIRAANTISKAFSGSH